MPAVANGAAYPMNYPVAGAPDAFEITPSDTVNNNKIASSLWCGAAGDVAVITAMGNVVLFRAVPAGTLLPVQCLRVNVTNTTASLNSFVGLM